MVGAVLGGFQCCHSVPTLSYRLAVLYFVNGKCLVNNNWTNPFVGSVAITDNPLIYYCMYFAAIEYVNVFCINHFRCSKTVAAGISSVISDNLMCSKLLKYVFEPSSVTKSNEAKQLH